MRRLSLLPAIALAAACAKTETPEQMQTRMQAESDSARPAVLEIVAQYSAHFNAGHVDSLVALHATDAVVMPPNGPTASGHDAIRQMFAAQVEPPGTRALSIQMQSVTVNGPLATDRGRWSYSYTPAAGSPMPAIADSGRYLNRLQKVDGRWLIAEEIWNSEVPLPPPPPARGVRR